MKKISMMFVLVLFFISARAGVPTTDVSQIGKMQEQITLMQKQYAEKFKQFESYMQTFEKYKSQLEGITMHAQMLQDKVKSMHDFKIEDINDLRGIFSSASHIGNLSKSISEKFQILTPEAAYPGDDKNSQIKRAMYQRQGDVLFGNMAVAENALKTINGRKGQLANLTKSLTTASTQAAKLDIQGRIAAEQALMQNEILEALYIRMNMDLLFKNQERNLIADQIELGDGMRLK